MLKIIGITGGVGSGKSAVLEYLEKREQTVVCQADQVAFDLQQPGQECYNRMRQHFGDEILNPDGSNTINREKLASIVFQDQTQLELLNQMIHPEVKHMILKKIDKAKSEAKHYFFLEAALLLEESYDKICDEVWYIYVSEDKRRERLKKSRGYSDEKITEIISKQMTEDMFRNRCQKIIDNNGTLEELYDSIRQKIEDL